MKIIIILVLWGTSFLAASQHAVIFDYGDVLAFRKREILDEFLCKTFQITKEELAKAKIVKQAFDGSDEMFWIDFSNMKGLRLSHRWEEMYREALRNSLGVSGDMYRIVGDLKLKGIKVGLLSNIEKKYAIIAKEFGLFEPFDPCLLTCDLGIKKPNFMAYEILLKSINIEPANTVFIDDNHVNVEAAIEVGLDGIVFESPEQVRIELEKRGLL